MISFYLEMFFVHIDPSPYVALVYLSLLGAKEVEFFPVSDVLIMCEEKCLI